MKYVKETTVDSSIAGHVDKSDLKQEPCFLTKIHSDEFSEDGSIQLPACKHSHCHKDCGQEALAISFCQYCVIFKISLLHFFENITQYLIYEVLVYFRMIFMCIVQT